MRRSGNSMWTLADERPTKIRLEASSVCQLRCPSCPNTRGITRSVIGRGFLRSADFRKLVDENPWVREIEISNYGEMFLNPELKEIVEYAFLRDVALSANNGVNLNSAEEQVLEALVRCNFRSMTCSIDGASEETYREYRSGGDFNKVIGNIEKINSFKRKYRSASPRLKWQFLVFGFNEHEIPLARALAGKLNMSFQLKLSWDPEFSPVRDRKYIRKEMGAASREEYREVHGVDYLHGLCNQLWEQPQINWDGEVLGCTRNFWRDFGGNAFEDGLIPSIHGERINYARDMLLGKKEARDDIPCSTCNIYLDMRRSGKWIERGTASLPRRALRTAYRSPGIRRLLRAISERF